MMRLLAISVFIILSCNEKSIPDSFEWKNMSIELRDSITYLANSGRIPNSIEGSVGVEPKDYSKVIWILKNATTENLEKLLYEHPSGEIKGIAAKGLILRKSDRLFDHFKFAIDQNLNVRYYMSCQKLGGYFLNELTKSVPSNLNLYFSEKQVEELNKMIGNRNFNCD